MYLDHFGLTAKPFQISANPRFLWLGEKHKEALAILKYGIFDNRGFLLLSGDVGTGKTTLINALLKNLGDETVVATVPDPGLGLMDFYNYISRGFGLKQRFDNKEAFLEVFEAFLQKNEADRKRVLLIIDESQRLTSELLEEIRLLSNIEKDYTKLLNIFFVGQNEFNDIILEQQNRPLRQRITINYNIEPLEEHEITEYVHFRLSVAGCRRKLFDGAALREIYQYSKGYPRLINIICDHALLTAFVQGSTIVSGEIVRECAGELKIQSVTRKDQPNPAPVAETYPGPTAVSMSAPPTPLPLSGSFKRYHRVDYWIYGVIVSLLFFIAGYLVFSAPKKFASLIGLGPEDSISRIEVRREGPAEPDAPENDATSMVLSERSSDTAPDVESNRPSQTLQSFQPETSHTGTSSTGPQAAIAEEILPEWAPEAQPLPTVSQADIAPETPDPGPPEVVPEEALRVYFKHDSNELTSEAYDVLERTAKVLKQHPDTTLSIRGYTDTSGSYSYNIKISEFRANIVKTYLVGKGLDPGRASTFGMGPANPIASNDTFEGRQLNRRVEIEFYR